MKVNTFRALLTASWIMFILGSLLSSTLGPSLPKALSDYLEWQVSSDAPVDVLIAGDILYLVRIFLFMGLAVSYIGLYRWKEWGSHLFIVVRALGLVASAIWLYTTVEPGLVTVTWSAGCIIDGMLITAMCWAEPIRSKFEADELLVEEGEPEDPPSPF